MEYKCEVFQDTVHITANGKQVLNQEVQNAIHTVYSNSCSKQKDEKSNLSKTCIQRKYKKK